MFSSIPLLLPALIPSWRFFDVIAPSPRIEVRLLHSLADETQKWQEFRPRPEHISFSTMLKRMLWNPRWNETLYLVSCSERLMQNPSEQCRKKIMQRIQNDLDTTSPYFQFRLHYITRTDNKLQKLVTYVSPVYAYES